MRKERLLTTWLLALSFFAWSSSLVWASPLALGENIEAILAGQAESSQGFDFVVIGDSRDGPEVYDRILRRAKAFKPLFILNTGDIVRTGQAIEYEEYERQIAPCTIPVLHVPGNHDLLSGPRTFHDYVGELNWYFDIGGFRIIGLDNGAGSFSQDTLAFARKSLTEGKTCLVAFHMPPPVGRWATHSMADDRSWREMKHLIKEAHVPIVLLGHVHLYDEMDLDDTSYVISGGGGAPLYGSQGFGKAEHGFVLVQVRTTGITHKWVPLD
jgi:3',5'-cyclic AMP phosphodiesterase CpdA